MGKYVSYNFHIWKNALDFGHKNMQQSRMKQTIN